MDTTAVSDTPPALLLVDDDERFCEVLARTLTRRGFRVLTALDPATALEQTRVHGPAFAVVDLRIGEASGLELIGGLLAVNAAIRIVVLTGFASIATAVGAIKLGAVQYLAKPAEADDIISALAGTDQGACETVNAGPMSLRRLEWEHLQRVLESHGGNISAAARALNMHRRTLQRKLQKRPVRA